MTVIIIAVWMLFVGSVWSGWISITPHSLGILTVIVSLVVLFLEVVFPYWRRHHAD